MIRSTSNLAPPRYSPRAVRAIGFLKAAYNDFEIYVEDKTCHNMWLNLIRRCLPPDVRLRSINQVGDRVSVIAACRHDQTNSGRSRLYIIDGDLDQLIPPALNIDTRPFAGPD
jgi:hypothetical protein